MKEIKNEHTESNPIYEAILDDMAQGIQDVMTILESSEAYQKDWYVFRAYRQLDRLHKKITKEDD